MSASEEQAITRAEAQFASDYPQDALCSERPQTWVEAQRVVVRLGYQPKGVPLHPSPYRYYEVGSDGDCRELHDKDAQPYWPAGPRM